MEVIAEERARTAAPAPTASPRLSALRLADRTRALWDGEKDFLILLALFAAFRLMTLLMFRPGGHITAFNSLFTFYDWSRLSDRGYYPYLDFWMEHPPLAPWPGVLAYRLSAFIPPWQDPLTWFSLIYGMILLPLELGNLLLVYLLGRRIWGIQGGFRCAWMYAALFVPVLALRAEFDTYPYFFLLLSVYLVVARRPLLSGISVGLGFMVKLVPVLALPVALRSFGGPLLPGPLRSEDEGTDRRLAFRRAGLLILGAGLTVTAVAVPFYLANPTTFLASIRNMVSRPAWESVWALLDGYYSGGWIAHPSLRLDPASASLFDHPPAHSWSWLLPALAVCYVGLVGLRARWSRPLMVVTGTAIGLNLFVVFSKGYSPQFLLYLMPFIILVFPSPRGVAYSTLLGLVNLLEYPVAIAVFPDRPAVITGAVLLRTALVVLLTAEYLFRLLQPTGRAISVPGLSRVPASLSRADRIRRWWRMLSILLIGLASAALVYLVVDAGRLYFDQNLEKEPFREAVRYLTAQPAATVLIADGGTYARLYPFLGRHHRVFLVEGGRWPERILPASGDVYLFDGRSEADAREGPALERWLAERSYPVAAQWFANARVAVYSAFGQELGDVDRAFADGISLRRYALEHEVPRGQVLHVALRWTAAQPLAASYAVFLHLVDGSGKVVAQHDGQPGNGTRPTAAWPAGAEIADNHGLRVPADLAPGDYLLRLGLYDPATGRRLPASAGEDQITLARITVR